MILSESLQPRMAFHAPGPLDRADNAGCHGYFSKKIAKGFGMPRGSKPGERRGGRRVGSKNRRTLELESAARQTVKDAESPSSGQMPKEFLLAVSQNEKLPLAVRVDAAKAVVAFYSPRLANAHLDADVRGQYWISDKPMTPEEWEAEFCTETPDGV